MAAESLNTSETANKKPILKLHKSYTQNTKSEMVSKRQEKTENLNRSKKENNC